VLAAAAVVLAEQYALKSAQEDAEHNADVAERYQVRPQQHAHSSLALDL
jgi:hypothetical protein